MEALPPLDPAPFAKAGEDGIRTATDALMLAIGIRTGQQYVDEYARRWRQPCG